MRALKPSKISVLTRLKTVGGENSELCVTAILPFAFEGSEGLVDEISFWQAVTPLLGASALDEGFPRARAEFLAAGAFFAPQGRPVRASHVRVQVGAVDKRLAVIGQRSWLDGAPSEPEPFVTLPITWASAFGGPRFGRNPYGVGHESARSTQEAPLFMPRVEHYGKLISSASELPEPAGFAPLGVEFEQRTGRAGSYRESPTCFGLPKDHDPLFFNCAPPDQWAATWWAGDEEFLIEHMHPTRPAIRGRLPGVKARVFLTEVHARGEEVWSELAMRCDVVWLFPSIGLGAVAFHGGHPLTETSTITELLAACDVIGAERPTSELRAAWERRRNADRASVAMLSDSDLMPPMESGIAANPPLPDIGVWTRSEGLHEDRIHRGAVRRYESAVALAISQGIDPSAFGLSPPQAPTLLPDPANLDAIAAELERLPEREAEAQRALDAGAARTTATSRDAFSQQGLDYDALRAPEGGDGDVVGGPPKLTSGPIGNVVDQLYEETENGGPNGLRRAEAIVRLQDAEDRLREVYRSQALHFPPASPMTEEAAAMAKLVVGMARDAQESLAERDFTGADFRGLDLTGMDFSRAFLEGADLRGADVTGANFEGAVLAKADLRGAKLVGTRLRQANLGSANLEGASLDDADLTEAVLMRATTTEASFRGANFEGADMLEAHWKGVDLRGARFERCTFLKADLTGANLTDAHLVQTTFLECTLDDARFDRANLHKASVISCKGTRASFVGVDAHEAVFVHKSELPEANFADANLERCCLRTTVLRGASFLRARMSMSDISECDASGSTFDRAVLKSALAVRVNLDGASLRGVNCTETLLTSARIAGTDFTGAQLTRADLTAAVGNDKTRFTEAVVAWTRFDANGNPRANT